MTSKADLISALEDLKRELSSVPTSVVGQRIEVRASGPGQTIGQTITVDASGSGPVVGQSIEVVSDNSKQEIVDEITQAIDAVKKDNAAKPWLDGLIGRAKAWGAGALDGVTKVAVAALIAHYGGGAS